MADETTAPKIATLRERPELADAFWPQKQRIWPEFMFHDVYAETRWRYTYEVYEDLQLYLLDESDQPVAVGQTIPCVWDGTMEGLPVGWADSLVRAVDVRQHHLGDRAEPVRGPVFVAR